MWRHELARVLGILVQSTRGDRTLTLAVSFFEYLLQLIRKCVSRRPLRGALRVSAGLDGRMSR